MRAEQLSCVCGALWVTKEGFGMCNRMPFFRSACGECGFFFFSFFLEKAFQKRRLGGNKSESGWTWWSQSAELSYISSFHLQLPLIHDFTVLNSLKSCVNMLVGGHLHRLPCKPAQSTQKQHCRSSKIKKSSKKHSQAANSLPQPETSEDKKEPCVFLFFLNLSNQINHSDLWWK